jgi:hypothetical protein
MLCMSEDGDVTGQSMVAVVNLFLVDIDRGEFCAWTRVLVTLAIGLMS